LAGAEKVSVLTKRLLMRYSTLFFQKIPIQHPQKDYTMKQLYQPHKLKRVRKIGFRARMATKGGRKVLRARRQKGRVRLVQA